MESCYAIDIGIALCMFASLMVIFELSNKCGVCIRTQNNIDLLGKNILNKLLKFPTLLCRKTDAFVHFFGPNQNIDESHNQIKISNKLSRIHKNALHIFSHYIKTARKTITNFSI